ncbi:ATP-dependent nuclease [Roseobacter sp. HKCCA0434]|uniref:ATP-dependent nuclease n=1 Tax=Roseobacter sp. HKCCA0434 TaxID=3079297 RepID=UPI002905E048|nr:AAA family ATPase [Roseobacter sp. HKCCA0434]
MEKSVKIERLKGIKSLYFRLPGPGLALVAGENGSGKTTLLGCLRRIGNPQAFATQFPASVNAQNLDSLDEAAIRYTVGKRHVTYRHSGKRWEPTPKSNIFREFGYPQVIYIGASPDRITPSEKDFDTKNIKAVHVDLKSDANKIFNTKKYENLRMVNTTRGKHNPAFVFLVEGRKSQGNRYHSERNFGLGELCVLKLIRSIKDCKEGSLVIIDEIEMALHSKVQVRLIEYLKRVAGEKNLTIIFSTHSPSVIKRFGKNNLFFIERVGDNTEVRQDCYPAYALQSMADGEEKSPDILIYVEDGIAAHIVDYMFNFYFNTNLGDDISNWPVVNIVPAGPYNSIVRMLNFANESVSEHTRIFSVLDADVRDEAIPSLEGSRNYKELAKFQAVSNYISYLEWTPEVGISYIFKEHRSSLTELIKRHISRPGYALPVYSDYISNSYKDVELRKASKRLFAATVDSMLKANASLGADRAQRVLVRSAMEIYCNHNKAFVCSLIGRMI